TIIDLCTLTKILQVAKKNSIKLNSLTKNLNSLEALHNKQKEILTKLEKPDVLFGFVEIEKSK
ncbi:23396_t:CDS:1, partial [Dentiscutata erythropus]